MLIYRFKVLSTSNVHLYLYINKNDYLVFPQGINIEEDQEINIDLNCIRCFEKTGLPDFETIK